MSLLLHFMNHNSSRLFLTPIATSSQRDEAVHLSLSYLQTLVKKTKANTQTRPPNNKTRVNHPRTPHHRKANSNKVESGLFKWRTQSSMKHGTRARTLIWLWTRALHEQTTSIVRVYDEGRDLLWIKHCVFGVDSEFGHVHANIESLRRWGTESVERSSQGASYVLAICS